MEWGFWKIMGIGVLAYACCIGLVVFGVYLLLKDVTLDGVAESLGSAASEFDEAYERGKRADD
jgi:hypothetical protein